MARQRSQTELEALKAEFRQRAEQAFDAMFGQDGQNGLVTISEREDRACEATDALACWLLEEHLRLDDATDPGVTVDCPVCGGPVQYDRPEEAKLEIREFHCRRGKVQYERAARRCPRCRKIFFPVGRTTAHAQRGVQPTADPKD